MIDRRVQSDAMSDYVSKGLIEGLCNQGPISMVESLVPNMSYNLITSENYSHLI